MTGTLPEDLFMIDTLESVVVSKSYTKNYAFNNINILLPIFNLLTCAITFLKFHNTLMTGSLPTNYKDVSKLSRLSVGQGIFTGTIPDWIAYCKELIFLRGGYNFFHGTIPEAVANLKKLKIGKLKFD